MATLTLQLSDEKHERLCQLAARHSISLNQLIDELATAALAGLDAETRFRARAARGTGERGLQTLDELFRSEHD
jgi:hypothetical protein